MNTSSNQALHDKDDAGVPPAPPEAHQRAGGEGRSRDAILAGLRLLQAALERGQVHPNDGGIWDIFTNGGTHAGATLDEIDALCEQLA